MFLNENLGIMYENTDLYKLLFSGFFYPFNDCIYDIFIIIIIILLIVHIRAGLRFKKDYGRSLNELSIIEEERERKAEEETKEILAVQSPINNNDSEGMQGPVIKEEALSPENEEIKQTEERHVRRRAWINEERIKRDETQVNASDENDLEKTISDMKSRRMEEDRKKSEDAAKERESLENEEKIDSQVRRKIRKKSI